MTEACLDPCHADPDNRYPAAETGILHPFRVLRLPYRRSSSYPTGYTYPSLHHDLHHYLPDSLVAARNPDPEGTPDHPYPEAPVACPDYPCRNAKAVALDPFCLPPPSSFAASLPLLPVVSSIPASLPQRIRQGYHRGLLARKAEVSTDGA